MTRLVRLTAFVFLSLVATACSGSFEFSIGGQSATDAAVELIEGDAMAQRLLLDPLTAASCDEPVNDDVGTVFMCTGQSTEGMVAFDVTIEADDRIFAAPTNVVAATFVSEYAASAVKALNLENGFTLPEDAMDCGNESVVLDADQQMPCVLTDPADGVVYDAVLTVRDVDLGTFDVEILGTGG